MKVLVALILAFSCSCFANDLFEKPRICKLLPGLLSPLAIDPAIPDDFVALGPDEKPNISHIIFWGSPKVLQGFFKEPTSLTDPILSVQISMNLRQNGKIFEGEKELIQQMKSHGFAVMRSKKLEWGMYPVWLVQLKSPQEEIVDIAWVGINSQEGTVLMFNPLYPKDTKRQNHPFWEAFLTKTKQLKDKEFFLAHGLDLREGQTLVQEGNASMRVTAERRNFDHKLLVVVEPMNDNTEFDLSEIKVGKMGGKWKTNRLVAKVEGHIVS